MIGVKKYLQTHTLTQTDTRTQRNIINNGRKKTIKLKKKKVLKLIKKLLRK